MKHITTKFEKFNESNDSADKIIEDRYAEYDGDVTKLFDDAIKINSIEIGTMILSTLKKFFKANLNTDNEAWIAGIKRFHEKHKDELEHKKSGDYKLDDSSINAIFDLALQMSEMEIAVYILGKVKEYAPYITKNKIWVEGIVRFHEKFKDQLPSASK